jgi:hypothetical protein
MATRSKGPKEYVAMKDGDVEEAEYVDDDDDGAEENSLSGDSVQDGGAEDSGSE